MSGNNPEELFSSVYEGWDLVSEEEKEEIAKMDDKFEVRGSLGAHEIKALRKLIKDIQNRKQL